MTRRAQSDEEEEEEEELVVEFVDTLAQVLVFGVLA